MKTKTARIGFGDNGKKITCTSTGEKDAWGKVYWEDADGNLYELKYARLARCYAFVPTGKRGNQIAE